jgi:hypothetical protein
MPRVSVDTGPFKFQAVTEITLSRIRKVFAYEICGLKYTEEDSDLSHYNCLFNFIQTHKYKSIK